ncbi:hypothetical protein PoB_001587700 [Plakobranchus ocellatus]|uniref:Uncharacterized protein n=1 Tax=Plakobranchus ocellatus TaxID=259542 RepID=A0AAV3Z2E4_9GAST|nr:hypothetical protein PoB_001587700 [Plakobranchus ocellatus]
MLQLSLHDLTGITSRCFLLPLARVGGSKVCSDRKYFPRAVCLLHTFYIAPCKPVSCFSLTSGNRSQKQSALWVSQTGIERIAEDDLGLDSFLLEGRKEEEEIEKEEEEKGGGGGGGGGGGELPLCDAHPTTSGVFGPRPSRRLCPLPQHPQTVSNRRSNPSAAAAAAATTTAAALSQLNMPPPKKPKNGPTREEQFLSGEELRVLDQTTARSAAPRPEGKEEPSTTMARASSHSPEASSPSTSPLGANTKGGSVSSSPSTPSVVVGSVQGLSQGPASGERFRKVPVSSKGFRRANSGGSHVYSPDKPLHSPALDAHPPSLDDASLRLMRSTSSSTPSTSDVEPGGGPGFSQPSPCSTSGRLIERLFSERIQNDVGSGVAVPGSAFREHQQRSGWPPRGLPTSPIGQPAVYNPDPRNPSLSYRLATSTAFASLVNQQPPWLAFDQAARGLSLRPNVGIDIQGLQSAASFTVQQQQQHQHQQQLNQQHQRRPILASLFSSNVGAELTSPPSGDDVFLLRSSSPGGLRPSPSSSSSYLSSVMRHASPAGLRASAALASAAAPRASGGSGPTHRTESAPVYLHPAFQLPPSSSTSSIRKNHSTSTLAPLASSPPSPGPAHPLPRHCVNATAPAAALLPRSSPPLRQLNTGHELVLQAFRGSSGSTASHTDTSFGSNGNGINKNNNNNSHNINNNSKDIHTFRSVTEVANSSSSSYLIRTHDDGSTLLDLSLKGSTRPSDEDTTPATHLRGNLSRASVGSHGSSSSPPLPPPSQTLPRRSSMASSSSPSRQDMIARSPPRHGSSSSSPTRGTPRLSFGNNSSGSPPAVPYHGRGSPLSRQGSVDSGSPHTPRRVSLSQNSPLSRQSSMGTSSPPPTRKPSTLLTTLMEQAPQEMTRPVGRAPIGNSLSVGSGRASPANSDDSNSYINVTSPVAPGSLLRAPSGSESPSLSPQPTSVMMTALTAASSSSTATPPSPHVDSSPQQEPQPHRTSELAGLLTQPTTTSLAAHSTSASTSFTSFSSSPLSLSSSSLATALLSVKKEVGAPSSQSVPYALLTCKTETGQGSQDTETR